MIAFATVYNRGREIEEIRDAERLKKIGTYGNMIARSDGRGFYGPVYHPEQLFVSADAARRSWNRERVNADEHFIVKE